MELPLPKVLPFPAILTMGPQSSIAHYRVTSKLGVGGMGEVWRATDTRLNRDVAIKILLGAFAQNAEHMARFEREAQVLASLTHPNIAVIYGVEQASGPRALVMELVEGPTLADHIAQGPLPLRDALGIAKQITYGLEYAHDKGIIHRDLKPANVKITPEGTVKLLDFGLAKAAEGPTVTGHPSSSPTLTMQSTREGVILGTAAYMSPEQARGRPVDRRADIWAFGCVLYEMLTGRRAFGGESVTDTLAEIIKVDPDWRRIPVNTPKAIRILIQRCVNKEPKQRLQAIGEARITIEEVLAGKEQADDEQKESANAGSPRMPKARRSLSGLAEGFLLGAGVALIIAIWEARSGSAPAMMHFSAVTSFAGVQAQPALSPDGRSVAFVSNRDGHFNIYLGMVRGGDLVQVTHGASLKARPSWSPDGSTLTYAQINDSGSVDVWQVSALGGSPRKILLDANDPSWAPDGRSLVYENAIDGSIWTSGVSGDNPHFLIGMEAGDMATEPRMSPDGKEIAFAARVNGPYGELGVADVSTGKVRKLTRDHALAISPAWSPDSRSVYFSSSRGGTLNVWKIGADGGGLRQVTAGEGDDAELDVSSDGKRLVFGTLRLNIGLVQFDFQAKPGQPSIHLIASDPARNEFGPAYSPDGTHVAFFTNLKGAEHESIGVADANGASAVQLVRDSHANFTPRWWPESNAVVYIALDNKTGFEYRSIAISGGSPKTILQGGLGEFDAGRDGRLLYRNAAGEVHAFDRRDGKDLYLGSVPKSAMGLRWSPDGKRIFYQIMPPRAMNDPDVGLWAADFKTPVRLVFPGWVAWYTVDAQSNLFVLKGNDDMQGELWKVKWDGSGPTRTSCTIPLLYNSLYFHSFASNQIDVSPDGRRVVFQSPQVLQENIGMIDDLQ